MDKDAVNLAKAIRRAETGTSTDPYNAKGASGEIGAYQFMPDTWKEWSRKYLGQENASLTVANQNRVAYSRIKELKDQGLTPAQIASAWNSGRPDAYREGVKGTNEMGVDYDVPSYVSKVSQNYRTIKGTTTPPQQELPPLQPLPKPQNATVSNERKPLIPTLKAQPEQPVRNVLRAFANIPSSALKLGKEVIAPVNPFDLDSPLNIGSNIAKGFDALGNIIDTSRDRGILNTAKDIAAGPIEVAKKGLGIAENVAGMAGQEVEKRGLGGAIAEGVGQIAEAGIEDPLLIPSIIYAPSKIRGTGVTADTITATSRAVTAPVRAVGARVSKAFEPTTKALESRVIEQFQKGVKPRINMNMTPGQAQRFEGDIVQAATVIDRNKDALKFMDEAGEEIVGRNPQTLQELSEALEQTKKRVFEEYDALATQAGGKGLTVNTNNIASELDAVIGNEALQISNPQAIRYAQELKERLSFREIDAKTAQDVIRNYNESLKAFYRNPSYESASKASIDALVVNKLREQLDAGITGLTGESYQAIKNQYASLKAVEKDIIKAALRDARKNNKGLLDFTDILSGGDVVTGIVTFNPAMIARGGVMRGIKEFYKYLNSPNRAVKKMFNNAEKLNQRPVSTAKATIPTVATKPIANVQASPSTANLNGSSDLSVPTTNSVANNPNMNSIIPQSIQSSAQKSSNRPNTQGGFISTGYKPAELSTKILKKLEGKTTVSKQFISDLTNSGDVKQVEKNLIREVLERFDDKVSVEDFGRAVEAELLPLKRLGGAGYEDFVDSDAAKKAFKAKKEVYGAEENPMDGTVDYVRITDPEDLDVYDSYSIGKPKDFSSRYENISLPPDIRGQVRNYSENIYESPVKTKAGDTHFGGDTDNYFGHTRIEDMADDKTRRVIEVQSDLFQKGNLERELVDYKVGDKVKTKKGDFTIDSAVQKDDSGQWYRTKEGDSIFENQIIEGKKQANSLQQYNNPTAHFRMVREEVKKAAQDGKTKLQFPTGETAMKIEGLGDSRGFNVLKTDSEGLYSYKANKENLAVGETVIPEGVNIGTKDQYWVITDVLGDGKFKAMKEDSGDFLAEELSDLGIDGPDDFTKAIKDKNKDVLDLIKQYEETFDISGKVDTSNPIYKFYDKELSRYLKGKYDAKPVTDSKGVTWIEVTVKPEYATESVEAFGKVGLSPLLVGGVGSAGAALGAKEMADRKKANLPKPR